VILAYVADREGDRKRADRLARQALMELRSLSELPGVAIALRALSQFALEQQRLGPACAWLAEALEIACKLADCMGLARTLETLACVLASHAPEQTAYLAGGAAALRDRTGTVPWPTELARITRWYGLARRKIGQATFETEWRAGRAMTNAATIATGRAFVAEALVAFAGEPKQAKSSLLTPRQKEVVALVARGLTNEQIAQELVISPATARAHVEHVLDRLDLHSRAQVAAWASAHEPVSLIPVEDAS
jgi:DNA-binding CsgD family transcriptional regulator